MTFASLSLSSGWLWLPGPFVGHDPRYGEHMRRLRAGSKQVIRDINRTIILELINDHSALSRGQLRELSSLAGVALGTGVSNLINLFGFEPLVLTGVGLRAGDLLLGPLRQTLPVYVRQARGADQNCL